MEVKELLKRLNTDPNQGLSHEEVRRRLEKYGYNEIKREEKSTPSFWNLYNILILALLFISFFSLLVSLIFRISIRISEIFQHKGTGFKSLTK
ncbi:MAG: cation-transporting P-type ATPase [Thermodesulfobacteriota bacterium]